MLDSRKYDIPHVLYTRNFATLKRQVEKHMEAEFVGLRGPSLYNLGVTDPWSIRELLFLPKKIEKARKLIDAAVARGETVHPDGVITWGELAAGLTRFEELVQAWLPTANEAVARRRTSLRAGALPGGPVAPCPKACRWLKRWRRRSARQPRWREWCRRR